MAGKKMTKEEIIEAIKGMSALELSEMVKELEEVFGVTAAAPVTVAAAPATGAAAEGGEEEKSTFHLIFYVDLTSWRRKLA